MKLVYLFLFAIILTGCVKNGIAPASAAKITATTTKTDSVKVNTIATTVDTAGNYWFNGTQGTALIQITCNSCTAIATIGNVSTPFLFNAQGVGEIKYTPVAGLAVYIAICPGSVKAMKADIFDASHNTLYTYSGTSGNWNTTYIIK
jgi:hypothetical protein